MAANLAFDPQLLQEAVVIGGFKSKKEAINQALREFIQRHKQREIIDLFGKFPADEASIQNGGDYTKERIQCLSNSTLEEIRSDIINIHLML